MTYDRSSTQLTLSPDQAEPILAWLQRLQPEELYTKDGDYGKETEPHVTVLYGIKNDDPIPVSKAAAGHGPIEIFLKEISLFSRPEKEYDVLKITVESDKLSELHQKIKNGTDNDYEWPDYHAHLTLAYVKKDAGDKYVGDKTFCSMPLMFGMMQFRDRERNSTNISLSQPAMKSFNEFVKENYPAIKETDNNLVSNNANHKGKKELEEDGTGGTGAVAANVTGNSPNMSMPPDMGKKVGIRRKLPVV